MQMNKPSPRLAILRAQLAAKAADESFARTLYSYSAQNPRTRHHYHPDHNEDLANWLKSLAPAKPAAPQPFFEWPEFMKPVAARLASTSSADGAALVGVKLTHSVCILAHVDEWDVGDIMAGGTASFAHPDNWRACDANGWIPHTPTADSVCPVPSGVHFETLLCCSHNGLRSSRTVDGGYGGTGDCNCINWDAGTSVIAWRPIAKDAS